MPPSERSALRKIWEGMHKRCDATSGKDYQVYGARGIKVCPEWQQFEPFYQWAIAHGYKPGLTIDRINGRKGYSPGNCRWIGKKHQALNRCTNTRIEANGKVLTISQWSELNGIREDTIIRRLEAGWPKDKAVTQPTRKWQHKD